MLYDIFVHAVVPRTLDTSSETARTHWSVTITLTKQEAQLLMLSDPTRKTLPRLWVKRLSLY